MLPLFVLADSDIDEEELKPIILKMKRKLHKLGKRKKKAPSSAQSSNGCGCDHRKNFATSQNCSDTVKNESLLGQTSTLTYKELTSNRGVSDGVVSSDRTTCSLAKRQKLNSDSCSCIRDSAKDSSHLTTYVPASENCQHQELGSLHSACTNTTLAAVNSVDTSKFVALDCEFVGVGLRKLSALGRCSILDFHGNVLLDIYVRPEEVITDFRTPWSGIRKKHMMLAIPFRCARETIMNILKDKFVIGHAVFNDFKVLSISHPWEQVRDTANYKPLREMSDHGDGQKVSLKKLAKSLLGRDIQKGEHCSCEDAQAALDLYKLVQAEWEEKLADRKLKRSQRTVTPVVRPKLRKFDVSYLGDEFWPADLFEQSTQTL